MKKFIVLYLASITIGNLITGCGPSQAQLDAQSTKAAAEIFASQTAAAPTATSTFTPTATSTTTPTDTPTPSFTPTPESPVELPEGYTSFAGDGFYLALPDSWNTVNFKQENFQTYLDTLKKSNPELVNSFLALNSNKDVNELYKFFAMDSNPAGASYATANVTSQSQFIPFKADDLCSQLSSAYRQMKLKVISKQCDLQINNLDAVRYTIQLKVGAISIKEVQYLYLRDTSAWILTLAVDATVWKDYVPVFETIATTFWVPED